MQQQTDFRLLGRFIQFHCDQRHRYTKKITDAMILRFILYFAFDNVGSHQSTKSFSDYMNSSGRKINVRTVKKYYAVDIGMYYAILGNEGADVGRILENVIYLELIRRGYKIIVGRWDKFELDFVAKNPNEKMYIQVTASIRDPKTLGRELRSLQKISDHNPKYILTLDDNLDSDYNGIRRTNTLRWLCEK